MTSRVRKSVATISIACLVAASVAGCSKPLDPQSSVPAIFQPLVLVAAVVGVGILITSHNHKDKGGGSGPPAPTPVAAVFVGAFPNVTQPFSPFDISLDASVAGSGGVGAVGKVGSTSYAFDEFGSAGPNTGSYSLPSGYKPIAVAIDGAGNDWFVDQAGLVKKCPAPITIGGTCVAALSFSDTLPSSGIRSIAADAGRVFIAQDNLSGKVAWVAYALDGTGKVTGSYIYSGLGMYNADAVVATVGSSGVYTIFHKDGSSWKVTPPSSARNGFTFNPVPLASANMATDQNGNNYGVLGSAASNYQLGHYLSPGNASGPPGSLFATISIAFNGQTNSANPFLVPVSSLHTDGLFIWMLDASGRLVLFSVF